MHLLEKEREFGFVGPLTQEEIALAVRFMCECIALSQAATVWYPGNQAFEKVGAEWDKKMQRLLTGGRLDPEFIENVKRWADNQKRIEFQSSQPLPS